MRLWPRRKKPETITVHLVEWPSGREQGTAVVATDRDCAVYIYPFGTPHYHAGSYTLRIIGKAEGEE